MDYRIFEISLGIDNVSKLTTTKTQLLYSEIFLGDDIKRELQRTAQFFKLEISKMVSDYIIEMPMQLKTATYGELVRPKPNQLDTPIIR